MDPLAIRSGGARDGNVWDIASSYGFFIVIAFASPFSLILLLIKHALHTVYESTTYGRREIWISVADRTTPLASIRRNASSIFVPKKYLDRASELTAILGHQADRERVEMSASLSAALENVRSLDELIVYAGIESLIEGHSCGNADSLLDLSIGTRSRPIILYISGDAGGEQAHASVGAELDKKDLWVAVLNKGEAPQLVRARKRPIQVPIGDLQQAWRFVDLVCDPKTRTSLFLPPVLDASLASVHSTADVGFFLGAEQYRENDICDSAVRLTQSWIGSEHFPVVFSVLTGQTQITNGTSVHPADNSNPPLEIVSETKPSIIFSLRIQFKSRQGDNDRTIPIKAADGISFQRIKDVLLKALDCSAIKITFDDLIDGTKIIDETISEEDLQAALSQKWTVEEQDPNGDEADNSYEAVPRGRKWMELIRHNWFCMRHKRDETHHIFISYRQAASLYQAHILALELEIQLATLSHEIGQEFTDETKPHVFLDQTCLVPGEDWVNGFLTGLVNTRMMVLLCSNAAIERMKRADNSEDNLLLEWELALERYRAGVVEILPILIGQEVRVNDQVLFSPFDFSIVNLLPEAKPKHRLSPQNMTVREIVQNILQLQAPAQIENPNRILMASSIILEQWKRSAQGEQRLLHDEVQELRTWLYPLDAEMQSEKERLMDSHLKGTRTWLLDWVMQFVNDETIHERVLWIQGSPGVGKSVMAAYVADELQKRAQLGAMFFLKHDDQERNDPRMLLQTLSFSLACWNSSYGRQLLAVQKRDPDIINQAVPQLFKELILQPLLAISSTNPKHVVLIIDALDECGDFGNRGDILNIFGIECGHLPSFVKLVITSRPEADIKKALKDLDTKDLVPTSEQNRADTLLYAKYFISSYGFSSNDLNEAAELLVKKSEGSFVWLVMACKDLEHRLSKNEKLSLMDIRRLPAGFEGMGSIYQATFERITSDEHHHNPDALLWQVLACIVLAYEPFTVWAIYEILRQDQKVEIGQVKQCVTILQPVLFSDPTTRKIRLFHKSVADYVTKGDANGPLIPGDKWHPFLALKLLKRLSSFLRFNLCGLDYGGVNADVSDFQARVKNAFPLDVGYAIMHVWRHLGEVISANALTDDLKKAFCTTVREHLHHWFEAMSLLEETNSIVRSLSCLDGLPAVVAQDTDEAMTETLQLLKDAQRVYQIFRTPIEAGALQIYVTAIPLSPPDTTWYKHFRPMIPADLPVPNFIACRQKHWSACTMVLERHTGAVNDVAFGEDGWFVVSGGKDAKVIVWDAKSGVVVRVIEGHTGEVTAVAMSGHFRGKKIISSSGDGTVRKWSLATGEQLWATELDIERRAVEDFSVSDDGKTIAAATSHSAYILDAKSGVIRDQVPGTGGVIAIAPNGKFVVVGDSENDAVNVWDTETKKLFKLSGQVEALYQLRVGASSDLVIAAARSCGLIVWNVESRERLWEMPNPQDPILGQIVALGLSNNEKLIVTGDSEKIIRVWDFSTGTLVRSFEGHVDTVTAVALDATNKLVVSASADRTVRIWDVDVEEGIKGYTEKYHTLSVRSSALSSAEDIIVTQGADCTVRTWDIHTGETVRTIPTGDGNGILAVSGDSRIMAMGVGDDKIDIWDLHTETRLKTIEGVEKLVDIALSNDGQGLRIVKGPEGASVSQVYDWNAGIDMDSGDQVTFAELQQSSVEKAEGWIQSTGGLKLFWLRPAFRGEEFSKQRSSVIGRGVYAVFGPRVAIFLDVSKFSN
ncbi:hypothetical protein BJ742DRAFT_552999 [Cladochytrium replicatum]|nr:hypothetical protein BJ742DRAFT_552999 [Cladochytrium replicatum]